MSTSTMLLSIGAILAYILMVSINALANIVPINGITTGAVSDSYPNLFAPSGVTFSIWGLIYILLAVFSVYQFRQLRASSEDKLWLVEVVPYFIISSIINTLWIFVWHYKIIWLSALLMLGLLVSLIKIMDSIENVQLSLKDKLLSKVPFGVYFGWITIASIANITTYLVDIGWNGFGITDTIWMIVVLGVGVVISVWRMHKDDNLAYGLVVVWAYAGIWFKHTTNSGFNNQYPNIITATIICLIVLIVANSFLIFKKRYI